MLEINFIMYSCPRFSQDRAIFHQKPGGDIVGWADPDWPNRTGYSIPCAVILGSDGGAGWGEVESRLGSRQGIRR